MFAHTVPSPAQGRTDRCCCRHLRAGVTSTGWGRPQLRQHVFQELAHLLTFLLTHSHSTVSLTLTHSHHTHSHFYSLTRIFTQSLLCIPLTPSHTYSLTYKRTHSHYSSYTRSHLLTFLFSHTLAFHSLIGSHSLTFSFTHSRDRPKIWKNM